MIYDKITKEKQRIEKQIETLETKLKDYPEGKLVCSNTGKYSKWYRSYGSTSTYIPKKERWLAEQLAQKKFLSLQLNTLLEEKKALDFYLRHNPKHALEAEQAFLCSPTYREVLSSHLQTKSEELQTWMHSPFVTNPAYCENKIYSTPSGNQVRSKSEVLIDTFLYQNAIPFRYECLLQLGDKTIFPDFTIRHPHTGDFYYWEHFGRMDDPLYASKVFSKMQLYTSNGIVPSIHLITTFETQEHPLNPDLIQKIIQHYFLD